MFFIAYMEVAQMIANERLQNDRKALEHQVSLMRGKIEEMMAAAVALEMNKKRH